MEQDSYPVFPFYLLIDVSASMAVSGCIDSINAELPKLRDQIANDPVVGDIARFAIVTFSSTAEMVLPLSDLLNVETMPTLKHLQDTNYRKAFEFMSGCIPHDMEWFKSNGYSLYRPAVFFITDGLPTDSDNAPWEPAYRALVDPAQPYHPNIVSFGFGDADHQVISKIGTFKAYAANDGQQPSAVLSTIAGALIESIVSSSKTAADGKSSLVMPEKIDGMHELVVDIV